MARRSTTPRNVLPRQPPSPLVPPPSANLRTRRNSSQPLKTPTPQESDIRQAPIPTALNTSIHTGYKAARGRDTRNASKRAMQGATLQAGPSRYQSANDLSSRPPIVSSSPESHASRTRTRSQSVESTIEVETEPEKAAEKASEKAIEKSLEKDDSQSDTKRSSLQRRKSGRMATESSDPEAPQQPTVEKEVTKSSPRRSATRGSSRRVDGPVSGKPQSLKRAKSTAEDDDDDDDDDDDSEGSRDGSPQSPLKETREEKAARTQALREQRCVFTLIALRSSPTMF